MAKKKKVKNAGRNNCIYIHGQEYQTLGHFSPNWTVCKGSFRTRCTQKIQAQLGVLEPRCPDCYRENIDWIQNQRK